MSTFSLYPVCSISDVHDASNRPVLIHTRTRMSMLYKTGARKGRLVTRPTEAEGDTLKTEVELGMPDDHYYSSGLFITLDYTKGAIYIRHVGPNKLPRRVSFPFPGTQFRVMIYGPYLYAYSIRAIFMLSLQTWEEVCTHLSPPMSAIYAGYADKFCYFKDRTLTYFSLNPYTVYPEETIALDNDRFLYIESQCKDGLLLPMDTNNRKAIARTGESIIFDDMITLDRIESRITRILMIEYPNIAAIVAGDRVFLYDGRQQSIICEVPIPLSEHINQASYDYESEILVVQSSTFHVGGPDVDHSYESFLRAFGIRREIFKPARRTRLEVTGVSNKPYKDT